MDCIGHGVAKSPTQLSDFHFPLIQEKESESVSRSVVSDSCNRMAVARQGPLSTGILQVRILEWVAIPSSREAFQLRDRTWVSRIAGRFFTI